jgi:hypothetical protein
VFISAQISGWTFEVETAVGEGCCVYVGAGWVWVAVGDGVGVALGRMVNCAVGGEVAVAANLVSLMWEATVAATAVLISAWMSTTDFDGKN